LAASDLPIVLAGIDAVAVDNQDGVRHDARLHSAAA